MAKPAARRTKRLTRQEAEDRVSAYLDVALAIIHRYPGLARRHGPQSDHAWSATYLPLTKLLGREFTNLLRRAGMPCKRFHYVERFRSGAGSAPRLSGDGDHVIPLVVILDALLERATEFRTSKDLLDFLRAHLLMANTPEKLDRAIKSCDMADAAWSRPVGKNWSQAQQWRAAWGRYEGTVPLPPCDQRPGEVAGPWLRVS